MGRDLARKTFARSMAVLGLTAAISIGIGGSASAAPADRGDDPVVLTGSQISGLNGVAPGKILAYKWQGKWVQIPVQIDERHTVSARSLYPDEVTSKYILPTTFDINVYADPKTRSGADEDATFDSDDELVFMGSDSGSAAPSGAVAPTGVIASSATKVKVDDPVAGGNSFVYLFNSTGQGDQSAGKDYVKYDFALTKLSSGQNMKDDYGYSNATNPEDSTVTTDDYQLHSTGRWMEDEMKISTGGASDTDILDREAVSAGGLNGCGRSEYTFSGNWLLDASTGNDAPGDDDDEGTYVAVIDGPVRAIRDFMGANSGPYVQSIHKYYADQENKTIIVRVHPIPAMYVWTDYSEAAVGMTYRDQLNESGVTVDGNPDTINQPPANSIEDGRYVWQQVTGSQGSVTTLIAAQSSKTDRLYHGGANDGQNMYDYAGYYLDDTTPTGSGEKQCGGDLKAYGASGVGISGIFPNSDPNLAGAFSDTRALLLSRIRYFGPPNETAADASLLRDRAQQPLAAAASKASVKGQKPSLRVKLKNTRIKARRGKTLALKIKVTNNGNVGVKSAKVCAESASFTRAACGKIRMIAVGKSKLIIAKPKVKKNAKGSKVKLRISYTAPTGLFGISGHGKRYAIPLR